MRRCRTYSTARFGPFPVDRFIDASHVGRTAYESTKPASLPCHFPSLDCCEGRCRRGSFRRKAGGDRRDESALNFACSRRWRMDALRANGQARGACIRMVAPRCHAGGALARDIRLVLGPRRLQEVLGRVDQRAHCSSLYRGRQSTHAIRPANRACSPVDLRSRCPLADQGRACCVLQLFHQFRYFI